MTDRVRCTLCNRLFQRYRVTTPYVCLTCIRRRKLYDAAMRFNASELQLAVQRRVAKQTEFWEDTQ